MRKILVLIGFMFVATAAQAQCDANATPANFASTFSSMQSGRICLASGSYGNFSGGAKANMVTITPAAGATVTFGNLTFGTSVRNITMLGPMKAGPSEINPPSNALMNVFINGVDFGSSGHLNHEGRVSIIGGGQPLSAGGNGVHILNSKFGPGGCSDGIQDSSRGSDIGPNNEFVGIVQGNCTEHSDAIQPYASNEIWIHGNYLHNNEQGIMSPDGVSTGYKIENNVIQTTTGYPCMHMGDTRNGNINRNVCLNGGIRIYGGNQNVPSQNMTIQNNVASVDNSGCTGCTITNNASVSSVTFVVPNGTMRCDYATKTPTGTGTGGSTVGLNDCGPPPPVGITVTVSPASVTKQVNQTQQFTATVTGTTNTNVTWTATCGSVGANGLFVAPSAPATCTVRATSQADASKSGTGTVTVTAGPPPPGCTTSTTSFVSAPFTTQTGNFTAEYDATPAAQTMDAVFGLSNGPATSYNSNAVATRFESSTIQARNGNDYTPIPNAGFVADKTYHFKLVVRIPTHTYDVFVNEAGSTTVNSLTGLAFRFEQSNVTQLNNWSQIAMTGSQQVCNFTLGITPPPTPTLGPINCTGLTCVITQTNNPSGTQFPGTFTGPNGQSASATARVP